LSLTVDREELLAAFEREYRELTGRTRSIRPTDRLDADLTIDSLLGQELLAALEDNYGIDLIGRPGLSGVRTVEDVLELVEREMAAQAAETIG
jgi:acyl carrier protein